MRRAILAALALAGAGAAAQQRAPDTVLTGAIAPVHDPVIIREDDTYYVFNTGRAPRTAGEGTGGIIPWRTSTDLKNWTMRGGALPDLPAWVTKAIPGAKDAWAPDISRAPDGRYRLYYSVSTFGSNRSAIGLATSATLDPARPGHGWRDEGLVVMSTASDDFNAIDPNWVMDREGGQWLSLGSFWTGIKLFRLDPKTGKLADPRAKPLSIARRPAPAGAPAPVEAPFIIDHGGWYYLFVSYDYCCKGVNSTYYTVVGRARDITGPYLGRDGSRLMEGGGTIFLRADLPEKERFRGPGHMGVLHDRDGRDYAVYHAYDREARGAPTLRIAPIRWDAEGWPVAAM